MKLLFLLCVTAIVILLINIKSIQENPYISIRIIATILFTLSIMRYISLFCLGKLPSLELINKLQYFYFVTIIGISIPFILLIWYITPLYREKIKPIILILICSPHLIIYTLILILKPFKALKSNRIGYILKLTGRWPIYLAFLQIIYCLLYILLALYGFSLYKHKQTRGQYLILIMCHILFLIDGFTYLGIVKPLIPAFTLTEIFGFLTIYYVFSKPTIDYRKIKKVRP